MLKGRFLGKAHNDGDAFCFLVLMEPEGSESSELPQVLADHAPSFGDAFRN